MGATPDDAELNEQLAKAKSGDRQALSALLQHHRPELERSARRQLGPKSEPQAVTSVLDQIFGLLIGDFAGFRGENHNEFADWLSGRLHTHTSSIRSVSRLPLSPAEDTHIEFATPKARQHAIPTPSPARVAPDLKADKEPRPDEDTSLDLRDAPGTAQRSAVPQHRAAVPTEQAGRVLPLIRLLPQPQQTVIRLRYLDGWRLADISATEKQAPAEIVGRLRLAVQTLKVIAARKPPEVKTWAPESRETELAIDGLLAEYLTEIDEGRGIATDKFIARNPQYGVALAEFFEAENEWLKILDAAAPTLAPDDPRAEALPPPPRLSEAPKAFGEYEIVDTIARGGMGVVYRALQKKLRRVVALKMILAGQFARDTDIQRFQAEAQAVAKLRHPNIVPIHEIGEHQGHHFYSMDYIEGTSLADEIRKGPLPATKAAELVCQIALAIDYAHKQGIVHRDLKPANILLDKAGVPHITDFGLAKRSDSDQQLTASGAVVGTPNYMPPEQAAGQHELVGPRSDVYSLGAVLYDMLTGRPPYQAATTTDVLNQVLLHDPIPARALNPHVPTDLDTIIGKCLRKEPEQRYASAKDLADDLTRYLNGDMIVARPVSFVERGSEWCKRNPTLATVASIAIVACVVAIVAAVIGYRSTVDALGVAQESEHKADQSFKDAKDAIDRFFVRVSEEDLLRRPGMESLRRDLLREADRYYKRLLEQRANDPSLRLELAQTQIRVGELTEELESSQAAIGWYKQALNAATILSAEDPRDAKRMAVLGDAHNALAVALHKSNDFAAARPEYGHAERVRKAVVELVSEDVEAQRKLANTRMNLGVLEKDEGHVDEALERYDEAQKMREELLKKHDDRGVRRDLAIGYYNLGNLAIEHDDPKLAAENLASALPIFDRLVKEEPANANGRHNRALCRRLLGDLKSTSDRDAALVLYEQARGDFETLAIDHPDVIEYSAALAGVWMNIGQLQRDRNESKAARDAFEQAAEILATLAGELPNVPEIRFNWAKTLTSLAELKFAEQETAAGKVDLDHALQLLTELTNAGPPREEYQKEWQRVAKLLEGR